MSGGQQQQVFLGDYANTSDFVTVATMNSENKIKTPEVDEYASASDYLVVPTATGSTIASIGARDNPYLDFTGQIPELAIMPNDHGSYLRWFA